MQTWCKQLWLLLLFLSFTVSIVASQSIVASHNSKASLLDLRDISWERIEKQRKDLEISIASVKKRRIALCIAGGSAALGCAGWLISSWWSPPQDVNVMSRKQKGKIVKPHDQTFRAKINESYLKDFEESRTFFGRVKQGITFGLSAAAVSLVIKRFDYAWEQTSHSSGTIFKRIWGDDIQQLQRTAIIRFAREVEKINEAVVAYEAGVKLIHEHTQDVQLVSLTSESFRVAWEALLASYETLIALRSLATDTKDLMKVVANSPVLTHLYGLFNDLALWAETTLNNNPDKTMQYSSSVICRKLILIAARLIDEYGGM